MGISTTSTDASVLREIGARLARQRLERNLTQAEVAHEAGLAQRTVTRIEAGGTATVASLVRILRALGSLESLDHFLPEPGPSPMEELARRGKQRRRASNPRKPDQPTGDWTWADTH